MGRANGRLEIPDQVRDDKTSMRRANGRSEIPDQVRDDSIKSGMTLLGAGMTVGLQAAEDSFRVKAWQSEPGSFGISLAHVGW